MQNNNKPLRNSKKRAKTRAVIANAHAHCRQPGVLLCTPDDRKRRRQVLSHPGKHFLTTFQQAKNSKIARGSRLFVLSFIDRRDRGPRESTNQNRSERRRHLGTPYGFLSIHYSFVPGYSARKDGSEQLLRIYARRNAIWVRFDFVIIKNWALFEVPTDACQATARRARDRAPVNSRSSSSRLESAIARSKRPSRDRTRCYPTNTTQTTRSNNFLSSDQVRGRIFVCFGMRHYVDGLFLGSLFFCLVFFGSMTF